MAAEMKASVLLTLKDELTGKVKAAAKGLGELGGAVSKLKGTNALGKMAGDASALAGAADKAASAVARVGSVSAGGAAAGFNAATKAADAYAAAAGRAAAASQAASVASRPTGADIYYHASKAEAAAKARTPLMAVKGTETQRAVAIANNLDRANPGMYAGKKGGALLEAHVAEELERQKQAGKGSGNGMLAGIGNKAVNTYFGYQIANGVGHSIDHTVSKVGDVSAMREKMTWALGGDRAGSDAAYAKAVELSGKYKNTSVLENMHVIDDLRANLPESMEHLLKDAADPFIKMHGFFKAWQGGKHAGTAEHALKDVGAAIRAGELTGIASADDLVKHTEAIAKARILFGEKFKVTEYLQATQKAATALSAADDTYKYVDFPILIQRLSQGAGVALATGFTKFVAGGTVSQGTAENWRALDLVDMDKVELDKKGKIKASGLLGTSWIKGGDAYGQNFSDAVMTQLVPALAEKGGLPGLKGLDEAWKAGDVEKAAHILTEFRKDKEAMVKLARMAIGLAKDRNAAKLIEETITGAPTNLRERERAKAIDGNVDKFQTYDKAKQEVQAQADRLLQVVSGDDLDGNIGKALKSLSGWLAKTADQIAAYKGVSKTVADLSAEINEVIDPMAKNRLGWGDWIGRKLGLVDSPDPKAGTLVGGAAWTPGGKLGANGYSADSAIASGLLAREAGVGATVAADRSDANAKTGTESAWSSADPGSMWAAAAEAASEATARLREFAAGPAVATMLGASMAQGAQPQAPESVAIVAQGPNVMFNQAPPAINVSVTVNATTYASPAELGSVVAGHVGTALRGAMHDGGN